MANKIILDKLLSVDWDFFFPIPEDDIAALYDWGHNENIPFMSNGIWEFRASSFIRSVIPLPRTNGEENNFWQRFTFQDNTTLYYSDSHCRVFNQLVLKGIDIIWNFDAHHDAYHSIKEVEKQGKVTCDNWVTAVIMNDIKVKNFFPKWKTWDMKGKVSIPYQKDNGKKFHESFQKIFICRSGAWTPTWIEDSFWQFINACPVSNKVNLDNIIPRVFSENNVKEQIKVINTLMNNKVE